MSYPESGPPDSPHEAPQQSGTPASLEATRRPRIVTTAAVFAIIAAVLQILMALFIAVAASSGIVLGGAVLGYAYVVLNLLLAVFSVWGGVAALRGRTNKILIYTALVLAAGQIIQTTTVIVFHYGSPVSTLVGILIAVLLVGSLVTARSRQFFAARGGTTAEPRSLLITGGALAVIAAVAAASIALTSKPDERSAVSPHQQTTSPSNSPRPATAFTLVIDNHSVPVPGTAYCTRTPSQGQLQIDVGDSHDVPQTGVSVIITNNKVTHVSLPDFEDAKVLWYSSDIATGGHAEVVQEGLTYRITGEARGVLSRTDPHPDRVSKTFELTVTCQ
jgi:Mycobacterium 19 kDa lipoprotein antigen